MATTRNGSAALTVLTVRLLFRESGAIVSFRLTADGASGSGGNGSNDTSWEVPFRSFNPSGDGVNLVVPRALPDDVAYRLATLESAWPGEPLWLKLARPYGMLGTAPWERDIGSALNRPLFRLPEFPERLAERPGVLENAVLVDPANDALTADVVPRVQALVRAVLDGSGRAVTRLHVFTSSPWFARLKPLSDGIRVQVHDPGDAQTSTEVMPTGGRVAAQLLRSAAWSNWIEKVMDGRGLDAVHLFCRARAQAERTGADLVLSSSPSPNETTVVLTVIDSHEICLLLNQVGAWAATFVPVSMDQQRLVAFVADRIAHRRPSVSLFHADPASDGSFPAACKLLFGATAAPAPMLLDGFLYCHPSFLDASEAPTAGEVLHLRSDLGQPVPPVRIAATGTGTSTGTGAAPDSAAPAQEVTPNWVDSTQRFLESAAFAQVRRAAPDVLLSTVPPGSATGSLPTSAAVSATLADIQGVVAKYLSDHKGSH